MVECARLESVYVRKDIAGSNPAPSAFVSLKLDFGGRSPLDNFLKNTWLNFPFPEESFSLASLLTFP